MKRFRKCFSGVSIHASSREDATTLVPDDFVNFMFQSTRPRGRTRPGLLHGVRFQTCFNPRVLAGGRDLCCQDRKRQEHVSIHASSREDATFGCVDIILILGFQSTRPRGRTRLLPIC